MSKRLGLVLIVGIIALAGAYIFVRVPYMGRREAMEHFEKAKQYYQAGDFKGTEQELKQALQLDSGLHEARIMLGDLYGALGRLKEAFAVYEEGIRLYPNEAELYRQGAMLYRNAEKYKDTIRLMKRYTQLKPDDTWGWTMLGQSLEKSQQWEEAKAVWEQCVKRFPSDPVFQQRLARVQYKIEHPEARKPKPRYKAPKGAKPRPPMMAAPTGTQ